MTASSQGYTLVELMVALVVTSIVLAGTYAAYSFFTQQQQALVAQTEINRNVLRTIDLIQSDIRMAGFKDYFDVNPMPATQPIAITSASPGDIRLVYDDYDGSGVLYRALIRYTLVPFTSSTGITRNRLVREWRKCNNPAVICDLTNSTILTGSSSGEPVLDWVTTFSLQGLNPKLSGSFASQFQTIRTNLTVTSPQKIEGSNRVVSKSYIFLERAKNVSLVP